MAIRQSIYDAAKTVLEASTAINYVTRQIYEDPSGWKENQYPAVRLIDGTEIKSRLAYPDSTQQDMQSEFTLEYVGYVRSRNRSSTEMIDEQNDLQVAIEKAIINSTALDDLTQDVVPNEQMTDRGNTEGLGWITGGFDILYYYNHNSP